jgi:hypothetical protein
VLLANRFIASLGVNLDVGGIRHCRLVERRHNCAIFTVGFSLCDDVGALRLPLDGADCGSPVVPSGSANLLPRKIDLCRGVWS